MFIQYKYDPMVLKIRNPSVTLVRSIFPSGKFLSHLLALLIINMKYKHFEKSRKMFMQDVSVDVDPSFL